MTRTTQYLLEKLESGAVLSPRSLDVDWAQALDAQESDSFETEWLRVHSALDVVRERLAHEELLFVQGIAEAAYRRVYEATSNPDAAGSVADDFELFALALASGYEDGWLNGLWLKYQSGQVPFSEIERIDGSLEALIISPSQ